MPRMFPVALLVLTLSQTSPLLAETREDRLALAQDYVEATLIDMDMPAIISNMWKPIVDQAAARGTPLTEDQIKRLDALYQDTFTEPMFDVMRQQAGIMADIYTFAEIDALYNFYQTELGRSSMRKLPQLLEAQQPAIIEMVQREIGAIRTDIEAILTE